MTIEEEKILIDKTLAGDNSAFEKLVIANQNKIYGLAIKITKNEQDALDISQEAFLKAYINLKSFKKTCRFSTWLYRIAYNLSLDLIRKNTNNKTLPLNHLNKWDEEEEYDIPDTRFTPEEEITNKENGVLINKAIQILKPEYREILTLREIQGLSYEAITNILGVNKGTVKSRIYRGRRALAKILIENQMVEIGV